MADVYLLLPPGRPARLEATRILQRSLSNAAARRTDKLEPLGEALAIIDFAKAQAAWRG